MPTPYEKLLNNIKATDDLNIAIDLMRREHKKAQEILRVNQAYPSIADTARHDLDSATKKLATLEKELAACQPFVTIALVLEHQTAIANVQTEIARYQKLIDDQRQIIAVAREQNDQTHDLMAQREELLTDIALGNDKAAELKKLDAQIEAVKTKQAGTAAANQKTINQAEQTISGLNRRLTAPQEKLHFLQTTTPKILDALLMAQAAQTATEFNQVAKTLIEKLTTLVAFDVLIAEFGQRNNTGLFTEHWQVKLPIIDSGIETPQNVRRDDDQIIDSQSAWMKNSATNDITRLKQSLINQGVQFS